MKSVLVFVNKLICCCVLHSQFLVPGFVDTHIHAPQYPNSGTGYDKQLLEWLDAYTFPTEAQFLNPSFAKKVYPKVVVS